MSKSKKVNPRRRPATRADVEKAKKQATGEAVEIALVLAMSVLHDKWGFGVTRLKRFLGAAEQLLGFGCTRLRVSSGYAGSAKR